MLFDIPNARELAQKLLQIESLVLNVQNPFTWSSGLKAPIYCDNRLTLGYPELRGDIQSQLSAIPNKLSQPVTAVAGVATAGIPHAALVAAALNLPMVYVRSSAKSHGKQNLIEGKLSPGHRILLIEDLVSTGGSSTKAISSLQEAGHSVEALAAIFTYNFERAEQAIQAYEIPLYTLTDYETLIEVAINEGYVERDALETLKAWRTNPDNWQ